MAKIVVAGAGHGGLIAAAKLARAGHEVLVFEKSERENLGMPQSDVVEKSAFAYAGVPIPPSWKTIRNAITFVPKDQNNPSLTIPPPEAESVIVDRKVLVNYLISIGERMGVKFFFGVEITGPILLGNRVCGIKTAEQDVYADLVIDACGVYSPVRCNLPDYMCINREIKKYEVLNSYRAYFNKIPDAPKPQTPYNIYLRDDGKVGFSWLITEEDRVDLLIIRFHNPEKEEILEILNRMYEENPQMGNEMLQGGEYAAIPVAQPLAVLVADGYAAVGDSAFMTSSIKGSGLAYSLKAGTMLARCVMSDTLNRYDADVLWGYQKQFFKEIGFGACRLAILKNILPYMTADQINDLLKQNILSSEELSKLMDEKLDAVLNAKGLLAVKDKVKLVKDNTILKGIISNIAVWLGKFTVTETAFPSKYSPQEAKKWCKKYNDFFDSIRAE